MICVRHFVFDRADWSECMAIHDDAKIMRTHLKIRMEDSRSGWLVYALFIF